MNYTKGPWELYFETDEYLQWKIEALSNAELVDDFKVEDDGEWHVSESRQKIEIASRLADEPFHELEANMHLMAASPNLLESCLLAYEVLKKQHEGSPFVLKHLEKSIRKALALASDADLDEIYRHLSKENQFEYKDYYLVQIDDGNYLFNVTFARDDKEEESWFGFVLDAQGRYVEDAYELSDDVRYHEVERIKADVKKSETKNLETVSRFLRKNASYMQSEESPIGIEKAKVSQYGTVDIAFYFGSKENGLIRFFVNDALGIRKFYLKADKEDCTIDLADKMFNNAVKLGEKLLAASRLNDKTDGVK